MIWNKKNVSDDEGDDDEGDDDDDDDDDDGRSDLWECFTNPGHDCSKT